MDEVEVGDVVRLTFRGDTVWFRVAGVDGGVLELEPTPKERRIDADRHEAIFDLAARIEKKRCWRCGFLACCC